MLRRWVIPFLALTGIVGTPCEALVLFRPLPRGGEAVFTVSITNPTTNIATSVAFESIPVVGDFPGAYVLESQNVPTCKIQNGVLDATLPAVLSIAPLAPRSTVECVLRMRRSPGSDGPAALEWKPSVGVVEGISLSSTDWVFGPVMDLSFDVEQIQPFPAVGEHIGFARLTVRNTGPWPIDQANFGYCQDFVAAPFELDNSLPGGCADAGIGPNCWAIGKPAVQFSVVNLAPGETKSCVLRATTHEPLIEPVRFGVSMVETEYVAGDELLHDFDRANDDAILEIAPAGGPPESHGVPLSSAAVAALISILLASGSAATKRLRR